MMAAEATEGIERSKRRIIQSTSKRTQMLDIDRFEVLPDSVNKYFQDQDRYKDIDKSKYHGHTEQFRASAKKGNSSCECGQNARLHGKHPDLSSQAAPHEKEK